MTNKKYTISVIVLHSRDNYLFSEFHSTFSSANPLKFTEEVSTGVTPTLAFERSPIRISAAKPVS